MEEKLFFKSLYLTLSFIPKHYKPNYSYDHVAFRKHDMANDREEERVAHKIKTKIAHLQREKKQLEQEIKLLEKKNETLHKQNKTILLWWFSRKLKMRKIKLDALNQLMPSSKF